MEQDTFRELDLVMESVGPAAALDFVIERFRREHEFPLLFEARLMKARQTLGLPLIQTQDSDEYPAEKRAAYEQAMVEAAREVGQGYLEQGNIPRAWPYLRAIGESAPVAEAIERTSVGEDVDAVIAIALQEGVNPARGLELIHEQYGMCRALTSFGMYAVQKDREKCMGFLVRRIHAEVLERMGKVIEGQEGALPKTQSLLELMAGRDWLFGEFDYYVDTSHLVSVLPYCLETRDPQTLRLLLELCQYGSNLGSTFHSRGEAPFEDLYVDYGEYTKAVLGEEVEAAICHFRNIVEASDPEFAGPAPAVVLVNLLVRLGRYGEAASTSLKYLEGKGDEGCPSVMQLFQMGQDFERLKEWAKERRDVLSYVAATVEQKGSGGADRSRTDE